MKKLLLVSATLLLTLPAFLTTAQEQGQPTGETPTEQQPVILVIPLTIQVAPQPVETKGKTQGRSSTKRPTFVPKSPSSIPDLEPRVHPDPGPVTREEYNRKKALYDARLAEQERIEQELLRERQEALSGRKTDGTAQKPVEEEVKLSLRDGLPPKPLDPEMVRRMDIWHRAYSQQVQVFKTDLGRFLADSASSAENTRRGACNRLFASSTALLNGKVLAAPDPEIAKLTKNMVDKFRLAAGACLEGQTNETKNLVQQGEQALYAMAAVLAPYKLTP